MLKLGRHGGVIGLFLAIFLFSACTGGSSQSSPSASARAGGNITFAIVNYPRGLDPFTSVDNESDAVWGAWWEYLVRPNQAETGYDPRLATSWDVSPDYMTYVFHLRPGVKFQDGSEMTSADVVYSLNLAFTTKQSQILFVGAMVKSMTAPDSETVKIVMKKPWANLLADLSGFNAVILPKAAVEKVGLQAFFKHPIGTGPFKFQSADPGNSITVVKNTDYWETGKPLLDSITFQVFTDDTARLTAVEGGQAQIAELPPRNQLDALKSNPDLRVYSFPSTRVDVICIHVTSAPFNNQAFREAISYAIDRQAIVQAGLFGYGSPASTFIVPPPGQTYQNTSLALYPLDLSRAQSLLKKSGVKTPLTVDLEISEGTVQQAIGEVVQSNLAKLGIKVNLTQKDQASVDNDIFAEKYSMATTFWGNLIPDPTIEPLFWVDPNYCCDAYATGYNNPAATALVQKAVSNTNPNTVQQDYNAVQSSVGQSAHVLPLFYSSLTYVSSSKVTGFVANAYGTYPYEQIGLS